MADLVVTVPKDIWPDWLDEGDLPGDPPGGMFPAYDFTCSPSWRPKPPITPGERVYVVAHGRLRGYAPLVECINTEGRWILVRAGGAVACTIPDTIRGFRGWMERWWPRESEIPFPRWKMEGVVVRCACCDKIRPAAVGRLSGHVHSFFCGACVVENIGIRRAKGTPYSPEEEAELMEAVAHVSPPERP